MDRALQPSGQNKYRQNCWFSLNLEFREVLILDLRLSVFSVAFGLRLRRQRVCVFVCVYACMHKHVHMHLCKLDTSGARPA